MEPTFSKKRNLFFKEKKKKSINHSKSAKQKQNCINTNYPELHNPHPLFLPGSNVTGINNIRSIKDKTKTK